MKMVVEKFTKQCSMYQHTRHAHNHPTSLLEPLHVPTRCLAWLKELIDLEASNVARQILYHGCGGLVHEVRTLPSLALHPFTTQYAAHCSLIQWWNCTTRYSLAPSGEGCSKCWGRHEDAVLEMLLRCSLHDSPKQSEAMATLFPLIEFWYNSNYHSALGPFKAWYAMILTPEPCLIIDLE